MTNLVSLLQNHPEQINAFTALCALVISFISILLTACTLWVQRRHNYLSVTPICSIPISDYEDNIAIGLGNTGTGPMRITSLRVTDGTREHDDLISWMPQLPKGLCWTTFYDSVDGQCIPAGDDIILLQLKGDLNDPVYCRSRDSIRKVLSHLKIVVKVQDIYGRTMPARERSLNWFGRHFK